MNGRQGTLHERIAAVLGWEVQDAQCFSLPTLRELVRPLRPSLAREITIRMGEHLTRVS